MGVSGCGKTTVGQKLAAQLGLPFQDADNFHPKANIEKMKAGISLTDEDRLPWLNDLAANIRKWEQTGGAVLACSALKESYRKILQCVPQITWIFLDGSRDIILKRLQNRKAHFMTSTLLDSQLETLEKPDYGLHFDIALNPDQIVQEILIKMNQMKSTSEFGLIGLGVMGKSLALNLADKNVTVSVYNRHIPGKEEEIAGKFIADNPSFKNLKGFDKLEDFVQSLEKPRKILLMIYAGAVDSQIEELIPFLEANDVIIDGGNSFYKDTSLRAQLLEHINIHFLGTGISGGEEGARKGPSIMPGGSSKAYISVSKYLDLISAKDKNGKACSSYIGSGGAGHFVKMVHNGIEYAEMQALSEVYFLMLNFLKLSAKEISEILKTWQSDDTGSYLLEITIDILQKKEGDGLLLDQILDQAEQKGTGGLSVTAALEYGVPYSSLSEAVMARFLSALKEKRVRAANLYARENIIPPANSEEFISRLRNAYQAVRIINHDIGFNLMRQASDHHQWQLNFSEIARIWSNGCIIRSELMEELVEVFKTAETILCSTHIVPKMKTWQHDLSYCTAQGLQNGFALPVLSAALNYFLSYTTAESGANLIQAQRDYFGAHTYQRKDQPAGQYFHTQWKSQTDD